jgi:hypothetical protein
MAQNTSFQFLLFETPNLFKFQMLCTYVTEGSSGAVTWFKAHAQKDSSCASSTWWPTCKTGLAWKSEELYNFWGHRNCPGLLSSGVILLCDSARPHTAQQAGKLLQRFGAATLDHPSYCPDLAPSNFPLFPVFKEHLSGRHYTCDGGGKQQTCYNHMADAGGTLILCFRDGLTYHTLCQVPQPSRGLCWKTQRTSDTFIVYCQLPLLKSCLWIMGTVNSVSDTNSR